MLSFVTLAALLLGVWVVWSGYLKAFFIISGICSVVITLYITYRMRIIQKNTTHRPLYISFRAISYYMWLIKEIFISSWQTSKLMWQIKPQISPTIACIPSHQKCEVGKALFANSITLTPGTVSLMVENDQILVHALRKEGIDDLLNGEMNKRVSDVTDSLSTKS